MSALFVMATEAVPFCELLIHRNVTFLKNLQKFSTWLLAIWLGTVAKMNCMNYLTFCNLDFIIGLRFVLMVIVSCILPVCLLCGGRIKIVKNDQINL